ncbi:flagellar protein FlgN [Oceanobacillus sp. 1P07AA]|uniref:flagellar protein FlgN n=1 Tax=Oceanobacillus sp. 1P07AA TaxID=3132293 RepID=UPI0039A4C345
MSEKIISAMNKLLVMHQEILELSKEKTVEIKDGHIDELQSLLVKERKLARQLQQCEEERMQVVQAWSKEVELPNTSPTISEIIDYIKEENQEELLSIATSLTNTITEFKRQEQLNQVLLNESMKFVQLSLDLISPTIKTMNYGSGKDTKDTSRSVFDSKA